MSFGMSRNQITFALRGCSRRDPGERGCKVEAVQRLPSREQLVLWLLMDADNSGMVLQSAAPPAAMSRSAK